MKLFHNNYYNNYLYNYQCTTVNIHRFSQAHKIKVENFILVSKKHKFLNNVNNLEKWLPKSSIKILQKVTSKSQRLLMKLFPNIFQMKKLLNRLLDYWNLVLLQLLQITEKIILQILLKDLQWLLKNRLAKEMLTKSPKFLKNHKEVINLNQMWVVQEHLKQVQSHQDLSIK